ncbi:recombination regulator RecX [Levilactobacillus namurensis]|uniref:recombination regulator RecX n=1 Tax=Levilactobacillus namurensis TaxID=380393 RepID=UPI002230939F|nr:recombination regulator RecX [Levilactobacillus namurensis]MCW3779567.1 recombination regulator RecX [Levilactobacillus namurensis]MDT7018213.1 recombination regulator RecX [Levilactobacillus namurensis]WNN64800.1 recombination regulator RecX [Levilactobacillus namurensis]
MAIITMIQAQKRAGRYNIYVDGHYAFPVSENVLIDFQLFKGMEIDQALEAKLTAADDVAKAYNRALDYLSQQLRTEKEVRTKLVSLEIPPETIDATIDRLAELHLVDDAHYAASYVRTMMRTGDKGPRIIRQHLRQKGVLEQPLDDALQLYTAAERRTVGMAVAQKLAKRYQRQAFHTQEQKIRQGLITRGFASDEAQQWVTDLGLEPDPAQQQALLAKQGEKLWHKYRTLGTSDRRYKTKQALYRKGFGLDDIDGWLEQLDTQDA